VLKATATLVYWQTYCPSQKSAICPYVVCMWWGWKTSVPFRKWILAVHPSNSI